MIRLEHVSKRYGTIHAVRDTSLSLASGQVAGLLGPNGAGKSTLIRMICGVFAPSGGRITINGHDTLEAPLEARRAIGYLPESAPLYPEMSVEGYLRYRAGLFGLPRGERGRAIVGAMDRCLLAEVRRQRIGTLSKGYRQRVGLAAAILHDPPVLVLDEPASGLDPTQQTQMRALIRELARTKLVLLSSHVLPEVEQICDRVLIMARGRVRADGTPAELIAQASGTVPYRVEVQGLDAAEVVRRLQGLAGVARLRAEGAGVLVEPEGAGTGDLRPALARRLAEGGALVTELSRIRPSMEQVFVRVIQQEDGPTAGRGEGVAA
jgi:ABC-2 type transport system ATP-binding protein